jgi:hypothetical protein
MYKKVAKILDEEGFGNLFCIEYILIYLKMHPEPSDCFTFSSFSFITVCIAFLYGCKLGAKGWQAVLPCYRSGVVALGRLYSSMAKNSSAVMICIFLPRILISSMARLVLVDSRPSAFTR